MKKWVVLLLVIIGMCICGCSKEADMSSLSEYEMVRIEEKNCKDFYILTV